MATSSTRSAPNAQAADFRLAATDGRTYIFDDVAGEVGTVIVFICNLCPYVKSVIDRLVANARALIKEDIGCAAICSKGPNSYPEDSFGNMKKFAGAHDFPFPYLYDETQSVARAYGAVCTPKFFGYDRDRKLKYCSRPDEGRTTPPPSCARWEWLELYRSTTSVGERSVPQGSLSRRKPPLRHSQRSPLAAPDSNRTKLTHSVGSSPMPSC